MNRLIAAIATIGLALPTPLLAEVDPKVHKLCIEAKDYQGCVKSQSGLEAGSSQPTRVINQEGAAVAEGNACPSGYGYVGGGYCQKVVCDLGGDHDSRLGGKEWACKTGGAGIFVSLVSLGMASGAGILRFNGGDELRTFQDKKCPFVELEVGWNSTCAQELSRQGQQFKIQTVRN